MKVKNQLSGYQLFGEDKNGNKYLYEDTGKATIKNEESGALITLLSNDDITVNQNFIDGDKNLRGIWMTQTEFKEGNYAEILSNCK